jgi:hypothetical protein
MVSIGDLVHMALWAALGLGAAAALMRWRWNVACGLARAQYQVLRFWPPPCRLSFWFDPAVWAVLVAIASVVVGGAAAAAAAAVALEVVHVLRRTTTLSLHWQPVSISASIALAAVGVLLVCLGAYALLSRVYAGALLRFYWDTELPVETGFPDRLIVLSDPPEEGWIAAAGRLGRAACAAGAALAAVGLAESALAWWR